MRRLLIGVALFAGAAAAMPTPAEATSLTGDCRAVYDIEAGQYVVNTDPPDKRCSLGSVTKSMTLYLALKAQKDGLFKDSDLIPLTEFSTTFGCTCLGSYATNPAVAHYEIQHKYSKPGEKLRWDDMLAGVAMSAAEPTVTVAEVVARKRLSLPSNISSASAVQAFVGLMNLEAEKIGLDDSSFKNPHGGAGFAPGTPVGTKYDSRTSAADMARLWRVAHAIFPQWVDYMGLTDRTVTTTLPDGKTQEYRFQKNYGYLAGAFADKNGSNTDVKTTSTLCFQCQISLFKRLGREFIVDVQMSNDVGRALGIVARAGLDKAFKPVRAGEATAPGPGDGGIDLACRSAGICYTLETRAGELIGRYWNSGSAGTTHKLARELPGTADTVEHDMAVLTDSGKYRTITVRRNASGVSVAAMYLTSSGPALAAAAALPGPAAGPVAAASFKDGAVTAHTIADGVMLTRWAVNDDTGALTKLSEVKLPPLGGANLVMDKVDLFRTTAALAYKGADGRVSVYAYQPGENGTLIDKGVATGPSASSQGLADVTDLVPTGANKFAAIGLNGSGTITNVLHTLDGGKNVVEGIAPTVRLPNPAFPVVGAALGTGDDWGMLQLYASGPKKVMSVIALDPKPAYQAVDNVLSRYFTGSVTAVGDIAAVNKVKAANDGEHVLAIRTTTGRTKLIRFRTGGLPPKNW